MADQTDFFPTATETFYITGTDVNGCQNDDSITIYVEAIPTLNAGADLFACFGDSVLLNATGTGTISWSGGLANNTYFTPTMPTQGCTNIDR